MAHQIQAQQVAPTQQQNNSLLHGLFQHLPQILGAFGQAPVNPAGAALGGMSALQGILGGTGGGSAGVTSGQITTPGAGAGANLGAAAQQIGQSSNPTPVDTPKPQGGGSEEGGNGGGGSAGQAQGAAPTDPLDEAHKGPPISKAPLAPLSPHQKALLDSLPPELFSFIRSNPGLGPALSHFVGQAEQYQTGV